MAGKHSMPISKYLILLLNLPRFVATITQEHFKISYITIKHSVISSASDTICHFKISYITIKLMAAIFLQKGVYNFKISYITIKRSRPLRRRPWKRISKYLILLLN